MIKIEETLSKIEEKKQIKKEKLLSSAYTLFIKKGINETSVNDIVNSAGIAKGTFYLYFKDKWDLHETLIITKTKQLFNDAIMYVNRKKIDTFQDKIINLIDYIINELSKNIELISLIDKNLSLGLYSNKISKWLDEEYADLKEMFINGAKEAKLNLKDANVTLFMIIELVGSTGYNSIINKEPLPIDKYKPFLYDEIRLMLGKSA